MIGKNSGYNARCHFWPKSNRRGPVGVRRKRRYRNSKIVGFDRANRIVYMRICFGTLCFSSRLNNSAADEEAPQVLMNDGSATGNHVAKMATMDELQVGYVVCKHLFVKNTNCFIGALCIVFFN